MSVPGVATGGSAPIPPKRGGIHRSYGLFLGGSALDDKYQLINARPYKYTTQLRNPKQLASIEKTLMTARNDASSIKFNGKLELTGGTTETAELDKEQFIAALKDKVKFHGMQNVFYMLNAQGKMTSLLDDYHEFTVEEVIVEHESRSKSEPAAITDVNGDETSESETDRFRCYDDYEFDDIALSRLIVESLLTQSFREKLEVRFSHYDDFDELPGHVIFMMTLNTCNASVEMDIEAAKESFRGLKLENFPGENVTDLATSALKCIKIMRGDYAIDVTVGSSLIKKVCGTSSEYFNRRMHALLDEVKPF